jgi:hypothetical protein
MSLPRFSAIPCVYFLPLFVLAPLASSLRSDEGDLKPATVVSDDTMLLVRKYAFSHSHSAVRVRSFVCQLAEI